MNSDAAFHEQTSRLSTVVGNTPYAMAHQTMAGMMKAIAPGPPMSRLIASLTSSASKGSTLAKDLCVVLHFHCQSQPFGDARKTGISKM